MEPTNAIFHYRTRAITETGDPLYAVRSDKVGPRGGATVAVLDNGKVGIAICSDLDNFEYKRGIQIAKGRAEKNPTLTIDFEDIEDFDELKLLVFGKTIDLNVKLGDKGCSDLHLVYGKDKEEEFKDWYWGSGGFCPTFVSNFSVVCDREEE